MFKLALLLAALAPAQNQVAEARAADVICGETGSDDMMATHVAYVIWNRMRLLPGARATKVLKVLNERNAFAGSCKRRGRVPTDWDMYLARTLVDGDPNKLIVKRWMNERVLRFTDRPDTCSEVKASKKHKAKHKVKKKKHRCRNVPDRWVLQGHRVVGRIGRMHFYEE